MGEEYGRVSIYDKVIVANSSKNVYVFLIGDQTWHRKQIQMFEMESKTNYEYKKTAIITRKMSKEEVNF